MPRHVVPHHSKPVPTMLARKMTLPQYATLGHSVLTCPRGDRYKKEGFFLLE
jgi:hypothetical protein